MRSVLDLIDCSMLDARPEVDLPAPRVEYDPLPTKSNGEIIRQQAQCRVCRVPISDVRRDRVTCGLSACAKQYATMRWLEHDRRGPPNDLNRRMMK